MSFENSDAGCFTIEASQKWRTKTLEYRAFNDETGQHEYYGTEEKATAAFWADIRYEWQRMEPQGSGAAWVPWAPTTTFEEHQAQQNRRWAAE